MLYKHWKKFALALTALFWAGCDDSASSSEVVLYGCPDDICAPAPESSSDANDVQSSSSETTASSSSEAAKPESSSSVFEKIMPAYGVEVDFTCVPMDSSVSYFPNDYSADNAKFWKEEAAKHDAVDKIDSIAPTLAETPVCLEHLRMELDRFVALYGAPTIINNAVEFCSDGTIRPSEEYAKFLKMQEEWEANKPALDEELKKVYEDKMKEIQERINKCLSGEADETDE
ncbi:hypothetical protein [Fibrobacter sp. UWP2]|uniref:hypothetical protein n=1 Tax=Fibrobacter sp. UWP2 TaxID=1896216 RepID=UPI00091870FC|nr:hypothetical protein [Fibrobacter sp. UWP2]SHI28963.1 hypothetical protein SAMN05720471_1019 [Fibrobacter sp. UWP2]